MEESTPATEGLSRRFTCEALQRQMLRMGNADFDVEPKDARWAASRRVGMLTCPTCRKSRHPTLNLKM